MKKLLLKLIRFFKKDNWKSLATRAGLCLIAFGVVAFFFLQDSIANVLGFVITLLVSSILVDIGRTILSDFEDVSKVSCDTDEMFKIYSDKYHQQLKLKCNKGNAQSSTSIDFCYAPVFENDGSFELKVNDNPDSFFELDPFIEGHFDQLISAHGNSAKYNGTTIRLDDFKCDGKVCTFNLSRSTIFNHLVTNRAIDLEIKSDATIRSLFEYGPLLHPIAESKMSNHIGINALVFLNDNYLLLPQRKKDSTISKNKVTSSIATKLNFPKTTKKIDDNFLFYENIIDNITDRVHIDKNDIPKGTEITFLGFGQNVYEGGKPQFYYAVKLPLSATEYRTLSGKCRKSKAEHLKLSKEFIKLPIHLRDDFIKNNNLNPDWTPNKKQTLDVDKCIHIAKYDSFLLKNGKLSFEALKQDAIGGKPATYFKKNLGYEMSFLCNLWHYERNK